MRVYERTQRIGAVSGFVSVRTKCGVHIRAGIMGNLLTSRWPLSSLGRESILALEKRRQVDRARYERIQEPRPPLAYKTSSTRLETPSLSKMRNK